MKILTVNLPQAYLKAIDELTGDKNLYPSRSELIRVAVREFLIKELEAVKSFTDPHIATTPKNVIPVKVVDALDPELFVQVPNKIDPNDPNKTYKTFRIIKKQTSETNGVNSH